MEPSSTQELHNHSLPTIISVNLYICLSEHTSLINSSIHWPVSESMLWDPVSGAASLESQSNSVLWFCSHSFTKHGPPAVFLGSADAPVQGMLWLLAQASSLAPILLNRENSQKRERVLQARWNVWFLILSCNHVFLWPWVGQFPIFAFHFLMQKMGTLFFPSLHDGYGGPDKISRDPQDRKHNQWASKLSYSLLHFLPWA